MKIIWPIYGKRDCSKYIKDGSIDGVSFKRVWKQCVKEANKYVKEKFPNIGIK
jgi:hypothetical protein